MKRAYAKPRRFGPEALDRIATANQIIADYRGQGLTLTLRQLYYRFVAAALIPNTDRSYKNLGDLVNDARMGGYIDWNAIEDRTRYVRSFSGWDDPVRFMERAAESYSRRRWEGQPQYAEVWIEKDALVGVLDQVCGELEVPYFSCRGYVSQSEMKVAADRLYRHVAANQPTTIFHLGDHDPSGIDMTRDIEQRLFVFIATDLIYSERFTRDEAVAHCRELLKVERIALTMDQIDQYDPPPNPAKLSDSRARDYIDRYGDDSWELDALEPSVLSALIRDHVEGVIDRDIMDAVEEREREERAALVAVTDRWDEVQAFLAGDGD